MPLSVRRGSAAASPALHGLLKILLQDRASTARALPALCAAVLPIRGRTHHRERRCPSRGMSHRDGNSLRGCLSTANDHACVGLPVLSDVRMRGCSIDHPTGNSAGPAPCAKSSSDMTFHSGFYRSPRRHSCRRFSPASSRPAVTGNRRAAARVDAIPWADTIDAVGFALLRGLRHGALHLSLPRSSPPGSAHAAPLTTNRAVIDGRSQLPSLADISALPEIAPSSPTVEDSRRRESRRPSRIAVCRA